MRIVVTGAAGFIASNLIPRLTAKGDEVLGIDNFILGKRSYVEASKARGFRFVEQDLLALEALVGLFEAFRPERVWHLAANSDISFGTRYTDFDLKGGTLVTYNVLEAMRRTGTAREILFSSSGAVYGEPCAHPTPEDYGPLFPISLYAASKLACEGLITAYAHNYGLRAWIFRFGNIVGPNPTHGVIYDFVRRLMQDATRLEMLGDGTQAKPYVDVDDCLDGMMFANGAVAERINCYNLAVDDRISVNEIADIVIRAMGLDPERVQVERGQSSRGWKGDVPFVNLDTTRMKRLGWSAKRNSRQAVERCAAEVAAQRIKLSLPA